MQALKKTALGQLTIFPVYCVLFLNYMGALEGKSLQGCLEKTKALLPSILVSGSVFWPIANTVSFMVIPASQRVLFAGIMGLFWNGVLSYYNSK